MSSSKPAKSVFLKAATQRLVLSMAFAGLVSCGKNAAKSCIQPLLLTDLYEVNNRQMKVYEGEVSARCLQIVSASEFVVDVDARLSNEMYLKIGRQRVLFGVINRPLNLTDESVAVSLVFLSKGLFEVPEVIWLSIAER